MKIFILLIATTLLIADDVSAVLLKCEYSVHASMAKSLDIIIVLKIPDSVTVNAINSSNLHLICDGNKWEFGDPKFGNAEEKISDIDQYNFDKLDDMSKIPIKSKIIRYRLVNPPILPKTIQINVEGLGVNGITRNFTFGPVKF